MPNHPVCIRTHRNDHVRTLKILQSIAKFGGIQKHENFAHRKNQNWVAPYCGCSLYPGKEARISHALHWDKNSFLIKSKFIKYAAIKSKHTIRGYNERFLIWTRQNKVRIFGKFCLRQSDERTNRYKTRNVVNI